MSSSFATITERLLKGAPHPHTSAEDQTMRKREVGGKRGLPTAEESP